MGALGGRSGGSYRVLGGLSGARCIGDAAMDTLGPWELPFCVEPAAGTVILLGWIARSLSRCSWKGYAVARVAISLDADLVIEVMLLSGIRDAQDAVEAIVRDYLVKRTRTEALTSTSDDEEKRIPIHPLDPWGG